MKRFIKLLSLCILSVIFAVMLVACVPSSAEKAKTKMKEEGYRVVSYSVSFIDGAVEGITATDMEPMSVDTLTAIWFESTADAKEFYSKFEESDSELVKRSGKCVYYGTGDAIEDFED